MLDNFHFVYVLKSLKDGLKYTGCTNDLERRFQSHQDGKVISTKHRRPFEIIYFEACLDKDDAFRREKYLKSKNGKMFLGNRLKSYLNAPPEEI